MNAAPMGGRPRTPLIEARGVDRQGRARVFANATCITNIATAGAGRHDFHRGGLSGRAGRSAINRRRDGQDHRIARGDPPIKSRTGARPSRIRRGAAWQLIDSRRLPRLRSVDAQVSELHCNFLINLGQRQRGRHRNAGETVRKRVRKRPASSSNGRSSGSAWRPRPRSIKIET